MNFEKKNFVSTKAAAEIQPTAYTTFPLLYSTSLSKKIQ